MTRPTWDEFFLGIMDSVALRGTCNRGQSGCIITKDKDIIATGYVGSPAGMPHCDEVGHQMKKVIHTDGDGHTSEHCVRTIHAEQNAICRAAKNGHAINGATLYCSMTPCRVCAMMIISCGIERVVAKNKYHAGAESIEMFKQVGVEIVHVHNEVQQYTNVGTTKE